jgi:azurin
MKIPYVVLLVPALVLLAGCGKKEATASAGAPAATPAAQAGPKTFELTANDTMKYNLTQLDVSAGDDVKLTLTNVGSLPREQMAHNWCLLKEGTDPVAFTNAAVTQKADDYFPASMADDVIAHTKLLGPKQSDTIEFKAPTKPGDYTYVCTFPGHYVSGMHGVLVVH